MGRASSISLQKPVMVVSVRDVVPRIVPSYVRGWSRLTPSSVPLPKRRHVRKPADARLRAFNNSGKGFQQQYRGLCLEKSNLTTALRLSLHVAMAIFVSVPTITSHHSFTGIGPAL